MTTTSTPADSAPANSTPAISTPGKTLVTGLSGTVLVLIISGLCIAPFDHQFFTEWVGLAFMAATPVQIVLGLLWHNSKPAFIGVLPQPAKGIALTLVAIASGGLILALMLLLVSGGHGITPMLTQYAIMTIVISMWVVIIWQCWPVTLISSDPMVTGVLALVYSYLMAFVIWSIFFDYSFLAQIVHPHYYADIDPGGLFDMWFAITFFVTVAGVIIVHMLFEFWPVDKIVGGASQPNRGIIGSIYILAVSWALRYLCVEILGMEQVDYMVRVPVCMIFGTFLVNNMMQFSLFPKLTQPVRGLALMGCAAIVAMIMHEVYAFASTLHAGKALGTGPAAGFAREFWIASAMLGVTFPVIFTVSGFFGFWPLQRNKKTHGEA